MQASVQWENKTLPFKDPEWKDLDVGHGGLFDSLCVCWGPYFHKQSQQNALCQRQSLTSCLLLHSMRARFKDFKWVTLQMKMLTVMLTRPDNPRHFVHYCDYDFISFSGNRTGVSSICTHIYICMHCQRMFPLMSHLWCNLYLNMCNVHGRGHSFVIYSGEPHKINKWIN